jgi:hypothetical protein
MIMIWFKKLLKVYSIKFRYDISSANRKCMEHYAQIWKLYRIYYENHIFWPQACITSYFFNIKIHIFLTISNETDQ